MSDYIPEEIVVQILKSLPAKSLLRFRSVCSGWKRLIDSPSFVQQHLSLQNQNPRFILNTDYYDFYDDNADDVLLSIDPNTAPLIVDTLTRPIQTLAAETRLVGTLHGVVCLYSAFRCFILWNPSIHKLATFPLPDHVFDWHDRVATSSAFWIDPSTREFKIVFDFICDEMEDLADGVLYSSAKQRWSELKYMEYMDYRHYGSYGPPPMIDGVVYWIVRPHGTFQVSTPVAIFIMGFDFVQETFDVFEAPHSYLPEWIWGIPTPFKWKGTLSIVYWQVSEPHGCDIYLRQQGAWFKMFCFNLVPDISRVIWVWGEMEEERFRALVIRRGNLMLYDPEDECLDVKSRYDTDRSVIGYDFVESLLFPKLPASY